MSSYIILQQPGRKYIGFVALAVSGCDNKNVALKTDKQHVRTEGR